MGLLTPLRLKLGSRKLLSGKYQVNFSTEGPTEEFYGYLLAEPQTPVREVVEKISRHLEAMHCSERYHQRNLYSLTNRQINTGKILIFRSEKRNAA
jgi:hypothetical protein